MADNFDLLLPIFGGLFLLIVILIGAYLCYYYLKSQKISNTGERRGTHDHKFIYFAPSSSYTLNSLAGVSPFPFSGFQSTKEMRERENACSLSLKSDEFAPSLKSCKQPVQIHTCHGGSSYEETLRFSCNLPVIKETKEEEGEEEGEARGSDEFERSSKISQQKSTDIELP